VICYIQPIKDNVLTNFPNKIKVNLLSFRVRFSKIVLVLYIYIKHPKGVFYYTAQFINQGEINFRKKSLKANFN